MAKFVDQTNSAASELTPEQLAIAQKNAVLPTAVRRDPRHPFTPGLTLFYGGRGTAKTTNALALHLGLTKLGVTSSYVSIMEPRAQMVSLTASSQATAGGADPKKGGSVTKTDSWQAKLDGLLNDLRGNQLSSNNVSVLWLDSLTYLVKGLRSTQEAMEAFSGATYPGGLDFFDILGVLQHSALACSKGVAMVGIVNSELFPVVTLLEGACEGVLQSNGPGDMRLTSRATKRQAMPLRIPRSLCVEAWRLLGSVEDEDRSSTNQQIWSL
jgi:hypothetical protein